MNLKRISEFHKASTLVLGEAAIDKLGMTVEAVAKMSRFMELHHAIMIEAMQNHQKKTRKIRA
jgi:hypothetical protein